jgi:hypothetical protein
MKKNTGILIHGLHLQTKDWEKIVWGEPPNFLGILPKGVAVALEEKAKIIVFGTGASEKDGKKEAEFTRDYLFYRFLELERFPVFRGMDLEKARREIEMISRVEIYSKNTAEEVMFAGRMFKEVGVEKIILVSSPTHISRCLRDAYVAFSQEEDFRVFVQNLFATPSQVCFSGTSAEDVAIIEPPHRPDRPQTSLNILVQRMLRIPKEKEAFLEDLEQLLRRYSL